MYVMFAGYRGQGSHSPADPVPAGACYTPHLHGLLLSRRRHQGLSQAGPRRLRVSLNLLFIVSQVHYIPS